MRSAAPDAAAGDRGMHVDEHKNSSGDINHRLSCVVSHVSRLVRPRPSHVGQRSI